MGAPFNEIIYRCLTKSPTNMHIFHAASASFDSTLMSLSQAHLISELTILN